MIYRPPEREPRARGRLSPAREGALVLVVLALVMAALLPFAVPAVPRPDLSAEASIANAPPTPLAMPQAFPGASPTLPTVAAGQLATLAILEGTPPGSGETTWPQAMPTVADFWSFESAPTGVPTVYTVPTPGGYEGGYPGQTLASPTPWMRPSPTDPPDEDETSTPTTTVTPSVTPGEGSPTATETPDGAAYP